MPWIRKHESVIQSERVRRRWSPWPAVMCFVLMLFCLPLGAGSGPRKGRQQSDTTFTKAVIASFVAATTVSVAFYTFQIVFGFPLIVLDSNYKVDICPECRTAMPRGGRKCQCQCDVEPIDGWTFKDDEE